MEMPVPDNTLPMMTGIGQFGPIEMGGMFTVMKMREGLARDDTAIPALTGFPPAPSRTSTPATAPAVAVCECGPAGADRFGAAAVGVDVKVVKPEAKSAPISTEPKLARTERRRTSQMKRIPALAACARRSVLRRSGAVAADR